MKQHRSDFEPFMEEDEAFETYCARMARVGPVHSGFMHVPGHKLGIDCATISL